MPESVSAGSPDHWLLFATIFAIFFICGLVRRNRPGQRQPPMFALGMAAVGLNTLALMAANMLGIEQFDILRLLTLREVTIESSFMILGYCLILRGIADRLRGALPSGRTALSGRTFL